MSYNYQAERSNLFTEEGAEILTAMRDKCRQMIKQSGAFVASRAVGSVTGNCWVMLAALDYMVEKGELERVMQPGVWAQHEIYKAGKDWMGK